MITPAHRRPIGRRPPGPSLRLWLLLAWALVVGTAPGLAAEDGPGFAESSLVIESDGRRFDFAVELAITPEQRARGLMYRESLGEDRGMLFDFGTPRPVAMWMRNTYVPLDMLFIEADGRIARIAAKTEPLSDRAIRSGGPVRAVLELAGGVTAELGIRPGDKVIHPLFSAP